jgi:hypothetical protein
MINLLLFAVMTFLGGIAYAKLSENPHNEMECSKCHKGKVSFKEVIDKVELVEKNVLNLCLKCHSEILNVHHPMRVQVIDEVSDYLPLEEGNSITCRTCHDVHMKDFSTHLLRSANIGNYASRIDICYECHKDDFKQISPHKSEREGMSCLTCHRDTPTIKDTNATVTLVTENINKMCNFCHNIDTEAHPLNVDKSIKLSEKLPLSKDKKVVCITCHDPHGTISTINFLREKYVIDLEFGKYENPHNEKEYFNCLKCHVDVPTVKEYVECRHKEDFILLCYSCHGADAEKCHPINIDLKEDMNLPDKFELDDDGLISCVTCHNPYCSEDNIIRYKNLSYLTESNCDDCHDFSKIKSINPHDGTEKISDKCYYCHKMGENMNEFGMSQKFICLKCHLYKEHPPRSIISTRNLSPKDLLPGINLDKKGKITCSTCHDPHTKDVGSYKLKIIEAMTICEACHQS